MNGGPAENLFVSLSGGADSLALLLKTRETGKPFTAVHFEHGIRGADSLADASFCRKICRALGVKLQVVPLNVPAHRQKGEGIEAAARRLRLEAWQKITRGTPGAVVLLGHHADDAAETLLMRLIRGSNTSGLAALRSERTVEGVRFRRPLLCLTRAEIEAYLRANGVNEWCHDATNEDSAILRNFLRNELLPLLKKREPGADAGIRRAADALTADAEYLEEQAAAAFQKCAEQNFSTAVWRTLPPALLPRVLRLYLHEKTGCDRIPGHDFLARFAAALAAPKIHPVKLEFDGGRRLLTIRRGHTEVECLAANASGPAEIVWRWRTEENILFCGQKLTRKLVPMSEFDGVFEPDFLYFDAAEMPDELRISGWRTGDACECFDGHRRLLKKMFTDRHIAGPERSVRPVVRLPDGTVAGVPGLCASRIAAVTPATEQVLILSR